MSTYYVLDTAHNKFFKNLCIHRAYILVEGKKKHLSKSFNMYGSLQN